MNKLERVLRDIQGIDDETAKGAAQVLTRAGFVSVEDVSVGGLATHLEQLCRELTYPHAKMCAAIRQALTEVSP